MKFFIDNKTEEINQREVPLTILYIELEQNPRRSGEDLRKTGAHAFPAVLRSERIIGIAKACRPTYDPSV